MNKLARSLKATQVSLHERMNPSVIYLSKTFFKSPRLLGIQTFLLHSHKKELCL